jgi:hypothetical protein
MVHGPWWEEETYSNFTGPVLTWDASKVHPRVYPNKHGWPMIPDLDILGFHMSEQKVLLCRYFAASSSVVNSTKTLDFIPNFLNFFRRLYAPFLDHVTPVLVLAELPL